MGFAAVVPPTAVNAVLDHLSLVGARLRPWRTLTLTNEGMILKGPRTPRPLPH